MAVGASLIASAANPVERNVTRSHSGLKEINRQHHAVTPRSEVKMTAPAKAAPANTVEVPFTHDLGKGGTEVKNYTNINVNNDNRKWQYGTVTGYAACMVPNADDIDNNDDWLFTVPIHLTPGDYIVSFEVGMIGTGATGVEMNVALATAPTVEDATVVISPTTMYTVKEMTKYEHNCKVTTEGYYYLGFHCTTPKTAKGTLKLANVGMRAGSVTPPVVVDPPAAGELTWTLAPKGELKATITYTAPTLTKSGKELTEISKVEITSRWGVDKFTYDNVTPGQVITIENVEMYQGINNRFTGVAYVGDDPGDMVEYKSIWCGKDYPLAPSNVTLTVNDDYTSATLKWDPVGEVGENGGYVDPEKVVYYIFDAFGTYYDPALAETSDNSIVLDYSEIKDQDFYAYQVTAGFDDFYSLDNASNIITAGKPDALPKTESFAGGFYDGLWYPNTVVNGSMQSCTITDEYFASLVDPEDPDNPEPIASQDGDGGFYYWLPIDKDVAYGLISTRADISKAANPVLDFQYQGQGSLIEVYAGHEIGELNLVKTIDLKENPTTGWTLARVPLNEIADKTGVMFEIRFVAAHNDDEHIWSVPIDNIRVHNLDATDVHIVNLVADTEAKPGDPVKAKAHVENVGTEPVVMTAQWEASGKTVKTETLPELPAGAFVDVDCEFNMPYNAPETLELVLNLLADGDGVPADNILGTSIAVKRAKFATVSDLQAEVKDSDVVLTWSHPENEKVEPETITEDFESEEYTPMSITGAGNWTVYDGDGKRTYNMFREEYNPYQTQPMAFQLFDNVVAKVPDLYALDAQAYSGKRFMLAPSAAKSQNDNWLISPELSGNAQTVKFMAKSFSVTWPETLEIYYSTTDNNPASLTEKVDDFVGLDAYGTVPEEWTEFSVELPEGAKYFAIHHDCEDTYALFVDDVTYEAAPAVPEDLEVIGYHIFRNGEALTTELHKELTYTDKPIAEDTPAGEHEFSYTVVPVYNHGAVGESNAATVKLAGIETISADSEGDAVIYNLQGIKMSGNVLAPGVYIRVVGKKAEKVTVK